MSRKRTDPFKRVNTLVKTGRMSPIITEAIEDSIENPLSGLGGAQDPGVASRPTLGADRLSLTEIEHLYAQSGIAQRACDDLVHSAMSSGWKVNSSPASKWWTSVGGDAAGFKHERIVDLLTVAAKNARRTGVGGLLLVPEDDSVDLAAPLDELNGPVKISNLVPFDRWALSVVEYDGDIRSPYFGKGLIFDYTPNHLASSAQPRKVHRDHLVLFPGIPLPDFLAVANEMFDDSVIQSCWTALRNYMDTTNAIGSIVQKFETSVMSIAGLAHIEVSNNSAKFRQRMEMMASTYAATNIVLIDADSGEKFERSFASINGLDTAWDRVVTNLVAAIGTTRSRLLGESGGGMGGDDEAGRALLRQKTSDYRTLHLHAPLLRIYRALLGRPEEPIELEFLPAEPVTLNQQATIRESEARALVMLKTAKVLDEQAVLIELERSGSVSTEAATAARAAIQREAQVATQGAAQPVDELDEPVDKEGFGAPPGASETPTGLTGTVNLNPAEKPGNPALVSPELSNELEDF